MKKRDEIPVCDTWNLADILPSDEAWEALFLETERELAGYKEFEGHLAESGEVLFQCLKFDEDISLKIERLFVYGREKSDEDTAKAKYQDFSARAQALSYKAAGLSSYIVPEILAMDESVLNGLIRTEKELRRYARTFEIIMKKKAHTLSAGMEELLARSMEATQSPSDIFNMFNNADVKFPSITDSEGKEIPVTHGTYIPLMENRDRRVRKEAFEKYYAEYEKHKNMLAATFGANLKQAAFFADVRKYPSALAASLDGGNIPVSVYDKLLEAIHAKMPAMYRYVALRKKLLGVEELHMYDVYVSLTKKYEQKYTYEQATEIVKKALAVLGEDYVALLEKGFSEHWVDVYENEGKRSGAYSWGSYDSHPYVLMSFDGNIDSVFTLAHEMGHSLHTWYSNHTQPYTYAEYRLFVAEVASTCNEALLIRYLLEHAKEKEEKIFLLNYFLDQFKGTVFRQTMFAEFEKRIHEKMAEDGTLTADGISELYLSINKEYFGPDMISDPQIALEWARIPHFYTPFYVYQYATGFSAAIAISSKILAGEPGIVEKYKQFLSGGCSMDPIDLLKICGVDMTKPEPVEEALDVFASYVEELEKLTAQEE